MTERQNTIIEKIKQQAEAGFSKTEITNNLIKEGYNSDEIDPYLKNVSALNSYQKQATGLVLLGISIFCAVKALDNANDYSDNHVRFFIYAGIGLITFICFIINLQKKKPFNKS